MMRALIVLAFVACSSEPPYDTSHPIDRIVLPKLRELGVPLREAPSSELCRRMAIDLLGRGPSADELEACGKRTAGELFDAFTAKPEYLREQRRQWGERLRYEIINVRTEELLDFDRLVGALYADELDYGEFATRAAMHPAMVALHPGDSWTSHLFQTYLGRPARQDELAGMRPFVRAWSARSVCVGAVWFNYYRIALDGGADEATAVAAGDRDCTMGFKLEWGINPCGCRELFGTGCVSEALGKRVEVTAACRDPDHVADPSNFYRASERTPGDHDCADETDRPECSDRLIADPALFTLQPFTPWQPPTAELTTELRGIGEALRARDDFWEAAVDRELHALLGWWQATFRRPDSDLPEVRAVLARELAAHGSVRAVQRLIVTSSLYRQPGAAPAIEGVDELPPWIAGPTKLLAGEPWLVTAAAAVGESAGTCDFRAVSAGGFAPRYSDGRLVERTPGSLDELLYPDFSIAAIARLGGCNADAHRTEISNIGLTFNQADLSRTLCAYGRGLPRSISLEVDAQRLVQQIWARQPRSNETLELVADMKQCMDVGSCPDREIAVRWMCQRMLDSAEFATY